MPGFLYHVGGPGFCAHGAGQIQVISANTRVLVAKQAVATAADMATIAGCPFMAGTKPQPCVTVRWVAPATRVLVGGQPALLQNGVALCQSAEQIPQGPPTLTGQVRVRGT